MAINISGITIHATPEKVWNAVTKPELVKQWQYGSDLKTDWQPGSPIRFSTEWQGALFEQWGTVLEIQPCHLLKYSLFAPTAGSGRPAGTLFYNDLSAYGRR
ncbi:SRPBCC family protein [Niabella ginsenosidivorans]|uniref:SRPBCC family protein n=1 Tax=Niabella ginsenosidivorans TaxID=1176587 RepID=UPI000AE11311|nr:SRPBCC family protein [Niabella ginsenosidivorans]